MPLVHMKQLRSSSAMSKPPMQIQIPQFRQMQSLLLLAMLSLSIPYTSAGRRPPAAALNPKQPAASFELWPLHERGGVVVECAAPTEPQSATGSQSTTGHHITTCCSGHGAQMTKAMGRNVRAGQQVVVYIGTERSPCAAPFHILKAPHDMETWPIRLRKGELEDHTKPFRGIEILPRDISD